jgi:hypothetical protein
VAISSEPHDITLTLAKLPTGPDLRVGIQSRTGRVRMLAVGAGVALGTVILGCIVVATMAVFFANA